jgi:hypothetical protein
MLWLVAVLHGHRQGFEVAALLRIKKVEERVIRGPSSYLYPGVEIFPNRSTASMAEAKVKRLSRGEKLDFFFGKSSD